MKLEDLPDDVQHHIVMLSVSRSPHRAVMLRTVCRSWRFYDTEELWERLYGQWWTVGMGILAPASVTDWKMAFIERFMFAGPCRRHGSITPALYSHACNLIVGICEELPRAMHWDAVAFLIHIMNKWTVQSVDLVLITGVCVLLSTFNEGQSLQDMDVQSLLFISSRLHIKCTDLFDTCAVIVGFGPIRLPASAHLRLHTLLLVSGLDAPGNDSFAVSHVVCAMSMQSEIGLFAPQEVIGEATYEWTRRALNSAAMPPLQNEVDSTGVVKDYMSAVTSHAIRGCSNEDGGVLRILQDMIDAGDLPSFRVTAPERIGRLPWNPAVPVPDTSVVVKEST